MNSHDEHSHTAIGRVIQELYKGTEPEDETLTSGDSELHPVEQDPNHPPISQIPEDYLEYQLTKNLIQTYRVAFATKGNGDPSGYGYYILEAYHGVGKDDPTNLVILYRTIHEKRRIQSYMDAISKECRRHWWFRMNMDYIRYCYTEEPEEYYFLYDMLSSAYFYHGKLPWDPFDNHLENFIKNSYYKIVGYDDWNKGMLQGVSIMTAALQDYKRLELPWSSRGRTKYTLTHLIRCILNDERNSAMTDDNKNEEADKHV